MYLLFKLKYVPMYVCTNWTQYVHTHINTSHVWIVSLDNVTNYLKN